MMIYSNILKHRKNVFLWMAALLLVLQSTPFAQDKGLKPYDVAKIEQVYEVALSPDGETLAYTVMKQADPLKKNVSAYRELYVRGTETEDSARLFVSGEIRVRDVRFTPDGEHISFRARRGEGDNTDIYVIPVDGGEARKALDFRASIYDYDWHPNGKKLVFTANEPGVPGNMADVPYHAEVYEEGVPNRKAYVATAFEDSENVREISMEGSVYQVKWSPEGDRIALSVAPTPFIDDYYMYQRVRIVDAKTSEVLGKVSNPGKLGEIAWSPDGERLAMISGIDINDPIDGRLAVVSSEGGEPEMIMPDYQGKIDDIAWVDDETIRYIASEGVDQTYAEVRYDGKKRKTLIEPGGPIFENFSTSDDGKRTAFRAHTPKHPRELYFMKNTRSEPERLTFHNAWMEGKMLARQEVITYNAEDGMELQGLLIYPMNYEEGNSYPLVTVVHGGPEAHYDNGWITSYSTPGQMAAALGMAVFYPNYRGSTGRGVEFAKSSQADPAGKEFDDIVDGVDYLIEEGIADEDKVGVTGGSYGGYATGWMATRYSDRFAAGVMFVGISNKISKVGTTDIPDEELLVHARKRPWDNWEFFLERSPIYHAGKNETPLLIMHGKEDPRVNPGQSRELYRHLKIRTEAPVRLVFYPGEGHGNARATSRLDYNMRALRWMEYYLKADKEGKPSYKIDVTDKEAYTVE